MTTASPSTTAAADSSRAGRSRSTCGSLARGDVDTLLHVRTRAPGLRCAHPTVEHVTRLFVTLGASADPTAGVRTAVDGVVTGPAERSSQAA